ncbi:hypothetical protein M9H77_07158 [Catharanthus roseus]|uniref:Uncharacterized protein n=1 Tax=Catharanthus roseus TaxID=4058 RepID=A0ACC0BU59_CATRO|nr:hypothetical protein M9H77_07158 [Catharanthus roseus]
MKAREEGMGKELSISFEDTSLSLSLNPVILYREFSFKEFLDELISLLYCKEKLGGLSPLKEWNIKTCYLPLPSPVDFCRHQVWKMSSTTDGRFYASVASLLDYVVGVLRPLFLKNLSIRLP